MTPKKVFLLVLDKRDEEKYRQFRLGNRLERIGKKPIHIWNVMPDSVSEWNMITSGDIICFGDENSGFSQYGMVDRKITSRDLTRKLWPKDPRASSSEHLIFFNKINEIRLGFHKALRLGRLPTHTFPGLYAIKEEDKTSLLDALNIVHEKYRSVKIPLPVDIEPTTVKKKQEVVRYIRDTEKSKILKRLYRNKCQVCDYTIEISKDVYYSETHHVFPLNKGGKDTLSNMIVLCPTHHAEFDFRVICISEDGKTIIDKNNQPVGQLNLMDKHKLDKNNILFQLYGNS